MYTHAWPVIVTSTQYITDAEKAYRIIGYLHKLALQGSKLLITSGILDTSYLSGRRCGPDRWTSATRGGR